MRFKPRRGYYHIYFVERVPILKPLGTEKYQIKRDNIRAGRRGKEWPRTIPTKKFYSYHAAKTAALGLLEGKRKFDLIEIRFNQKWEGVL